MLLPHALRASAESPVTLINRGVWAADNADRTIYTFSSYAIGAASPTRRVIAVFFADNGSTGGRTFVSATIGGIAADVDASVTHTAGGSVAIGIASATVPTGTTATLTGTFSGGMARGACWAVSVDNLKNTVPHDTATATGTNPLDTTINCLAGGFVLAAAANNSNSATFTWTGVTEQTDDVFETASGTTADLFPTVSEISRAISATISGSTNTRRALVAASYR
jgi:hypothetical protein